jgi:hypothetical protein
MSNKGRILRASSLAARFRAKSLLKPVAIALLFLIATPVFAQTTDPVAAAKVKDASQKGFPLAVTTDVSGSVSVEAVLIPPLVAKEVFGGIVSKNYAVISLTISNNSKDDSLIIHSIFMDYSCWLLSGFASPANCPDLAALTSMRVQATPTVTGAPTAVATQTGTGTATAAPSAATLPTATATPAATPPCKPSPNTSCNTPYQISSIETRIVRGQLLDHQPWTKRNWVIRALVAAGSVASAYTFTLGGENVVRSISAFNGQVIPAAQTFWPDATVGQMNRLSDMGFQVNKVIPRESSDIVVAFFPIDRFLTPGLKKLFMKSPALFFATGAMAIDPNARKSLQPFLQPLFPDTDFDSLISGLPNEIDPLHATKIPAPPPADSGASSGAPPSPTSKKHASPEQTKQLLTILNLASLNHVRMCVSGTMSVDVNNVPPAIQSVDLKPADGETLSATLGKAGTVTGVLEGSFLSGGDITIADSSALKIKVTIDQANSSDKKLQFTMTLGKALPTTQSKLTFQVAKKNTDGNTIQSPKFDLTLDPPPAAPAAGAGTTSPATDKSGEKPDATPKPKPGGKP